MLALVLWITLNAGGTFGETFMAHVPLIVGGLIGVTLPAFVWSPPTVIKPRLRRLTKRGTSAICVVALLLGAFPSKAPAIPGISPTSGTVYRVFNDSTCSGSYVEVLSRTAARTSGGAAMQRGSGEREHVSEDYVSEKRDCDHDGRRGKKVLQKRYHMAHYFFGGIKDVWNIVAFFACAVNVGMLGMSVC